MKQVHHFVGQESKKKDLNVLKSAVVIALAQTIGN